jgi:hypothetical protein
MLCVRAANSRRDACHSTDILTDFCILNLPCVNVIAASDAREGLIGKSGLNPAWSRHCIQEAAFPYHSNSTSGKVKGSAERVLLSEPVSQETCLMLKKGFSARNGDADETLSIYFLLVAHAGATVGLCFSTSRHNEARRTPLRVF